jgi:hypothetical protein
MLSPKSRIVLTVFRDVAIIATLLVLPGLCFHYTLLVISVGWGWRILRHPCHVIKGRS